jgi:hypothetical protein
LQVKKRAAVTGAWQWWTDTKAAWVNADGGSTTAYILQVYKDASSAGISPIDVSRGNEDNSNSNKATSYELSSLIAVKGAGTYTFTVTSKGNGELLLDSDPSSASSGKVIASSEGGIQIPDETIALMTAASGGKITVSIGSGYTNIKWYINGSHAAYMDGLLSISLDASAAPYTVSVEAVKSGKSQSSGTKTISG